MTSPALLSSETLQTRTDSDLDWELLLDRLAGYSVSAPGARRLRGRQLEQSWEGAHCTMLRSAQCLSLNDQGLSVPIANFPDLGDLIERLERGTLATGLELRDLGQMLDAARELRVFAASQQASRPELAHWLSSPKSLDPLCERLRRSIDRDGELKDDASPTLERVRTRAKQARHDLIARLKQLLQKHADLLQEQYFSERDGRYVLPVRADAHRALEGVVIDTSASGSTLFIEPRELSAQSNALRVALADVVHEEHRILRELSSQAQALSEELRLAENACTEADVIAAIARWAGHCRALAVLPDPEPVLELRSARHPLLAHQQTVVANDLHLPTGAALILSGPNAGGKTVTLKCLGLAARMARSGIPLCVDEGSRIGYFSSVFSEIGDSQSIVSNLSTFSAHTLVLASILARVDDHSLVLLDEVAAGTDPEQGSALAIAYLEALLERRATVAATTHYDALKRLGDVDARFHNAAVGFDVKTMMPTFRVLNGVVGPSTALAVASRFGLPDAVVERAQALLPAATHEREHSLEELASKRNAAEKLLSEAARDATEQRRLKLELEAERASLGETYRRQLELEYGELLGRLRAARNELETTRNQLRHLPHDKSELSRLERQIDQAAHTIAIDSPVSAIVRQSKSPDLHAAAKQAKTLGPGQRVYVLSLGADAEIVELLRNGMVRVRSGSLTLKVAADDLAPKSGQPRVVPRQSPANRQGKRRETPQPLGPRTTPVRTAHNTLDLRGERVDAGLARLEQFVDDLLRRGEPAGYVLHGHGTGAMKQAVREHVRGLRHVADSGAAAREDGGDAFTLLWLDA